MNNLVKLVQYFAILGAEETSELSSEVFTAYNLHMHKLDHKDAVQRIVQEFTDIYAVMELLTDAVSSSSVKGWDMKADAYLNYMRTQGPFSEEVSSMKRGAELATTRTDLYLSLVQQSSYLTKSFSKLARFGVFEENPTTGRSGWFDVVYNFLVVHTLLETLFEQANFQPDANRVGLKQGRILSHMRTTFKAGLL